MLTNVIAYLHTTFAYQSAAMQLMVGHANLEAQQLHLKETLPIVAPADTNLWTVAMPPEGVTGEFTSSNYHYHFSAGRLNWIQPKFQSRNAAPDPAETAPSQIDTNGAYQLARQWLTVISVDVPALESKYPHSVVQISSRPQILRNRNRAGDTNAPAGPVKSSHFRVTWGGERNPRSAVGRTPVQVSLEILGSTSQCIGLRVQNPAWFKAPPLQLTNTDALLGTPPPPQHFVEELLGGNAAYNTVAKPDSVTAWLVATQVDDPDSKTNRTPAVTVDANSAALLARTFTDFNSYSWLGDKGCASDYGVRLWFTKGADRVEFLLSYECDHLQVAHNGWPAEKDFDPAHATLVRAVQTIFPQDATIRNLSQLNPQPTEIK